MTYKGNFTVRPMSERHVGKGRAAINYKRRDESKRFDIVRIYKSDGRSILASVIGHWGWPEELHIDYDLRALLDVDLGDRVELCIEKVGWVGTVCWYLTVRDPQVRISAALAVLSVVLGLAGLALGAISLL